MLGGIIDWAGLPVICEMLGVIDVESLIKHLLVIRDFKQDQKS